MFCKASKVTSEEIICSISGAVCYFNEPDSKLCAEMYGKGPDVKNPRLYKDYNDEKEEIIDNIIDEEGDFISEEDEIDDIADGNF